MPSPGQATANRQVVNPGSPFFFADYLELSDGSACLRASIGTWGVRVFDCNSVAEDVAVYSLLAQANTATNANSTDIFPTSASTDAYSPTPRGRTFLWQGDPALFDLEGGRTYRIEITANLVTAAGGGSITAVGYVTGRPGLT